MKAIACVMFVSMVIFFILAVTGCQSTQRGGTCRQCNQSTAGVYYQEYCPECTPSYPAYYPQYSVVGCSNCASW